MKLRECDKTCLKKTLQKQCQHSFSEQASVCGWLLFTNEERFRNSPSDSMSSAVSLHYEVQLSSCQACDSGRDETLWNIPATMTSWHIHACLLNMVMKVILTLNSSSVANVVDTKWRTDNAMCWSGSFLAKDATLGHSHLSIFQSLNTTWFQRLDRRR